MSNVSPNPFTTRPEIEGTFGVVTSTHWIATAVGMATLEKGGNAFDAAVATGFTLQVVQPHLSGPGGDCRPILYHVALQFRKCSAPKARRRPAQLFRITARELGLTLIPGTGFLAASNSGCVQRLDAAAARLRNDAVADVLAPAIGYAQSGHPLVERASRPRHGGRVVSRALAEFGRGLSAARRRAADGHAVHQHDIGGNLSADP